MNEEHVPPAWRLFFAIRGAILAFVVALVLISAADAWAAENDELSASAGGLVGGNAVAGGTGTAGHSPDADSSPILRQDVCGNFVDPSDYRISALNLSNAAAVVLYEALRQTGFPGME